MWYFVLLVRWSHQILSLQAKQSKEKYAIMFAEIESLFSAEDLFVCLFIFNDF